MNKTEIEEQLFRDWHWYRCSRAAVKDGYCKQHHPDSVKARREESDRKAKEGYKRIFRVKPSEAPEKPSEIGWSAELPTKAGWYFRFNPGKPLNIVHVQEGPNAIGLEAMAFDDWGWYPITKYHGASIRWYGPIKLPELP